MKLLCWNCRGIGDPATVRELRDLVEISSPAILCLVETQLQKSRVEGLWTMLGYDFSFRVGCTGRSGGLCIFWKNSFEVAIKNYSEYHVDAWVMEPGKEQWRLTCFYGEATRSLRYKTWETMKRLRGESTLPWLCIGDFNEIL